MPKIITNVGWSASNVPFGLLFSETNGVFSGSPNVSAGEYLVPVSVRTNYGSDSKFVKIIVENSFLPVYAIGAQAERWTNNAPPDSYGFRKLDIPDANKLVTLPLGFAAKSNGNK